VRPPSQITIAALALTIMRASRNVMRDRRFIEYPFWWLPPSGGSIT
jgi:hypothetical protein